MSRCLSWLVDWGRRSSSIRSLRTKPTSSLFGCVTRLRLDWKSLFGSVAAGSPRLVEPVRVLPWWLRAVEE